MLKKSLASVVTAALLIAGPGHLTLNAAAQTVTRGAIPSATVTPALGTSRGPALSAPMLGAPSLTAPALLGAAPSGVAGFATTAAGAKSAAIAVLAPASLPAAAASRPDHLAVIRSQDASVGVAQKATALNAVFDDSARAGAETLEVLGRASAASAPLERASIASSRSSSRVASAKLAAAGESAGVVSLVKRAWNAFLGLFGLGVKKLETPEVLAQRIIDQLNAAKPVYNQKVADASTLVEKMRLQIETETKKVAELDRSITALLSDSDPNNDTMATGLINSQKSLQASIATTQEQLVLAEKALEGIKQDRANFFADAQEKLAKIQAGLTKAKAAEIQLELAKLKGGFQIGDLKDNEDRFDQAVNDKIAEAKGATDSVESNPDQILKKAKDELRSSEVQDEIARRKAAIEAAKKAKQDGAGFVADSWFYLKIGAGALAFLVSLAIVPEVYMAQVLGQIGTAFVLSLFLGAKESKLDAIAYAAAVGLMVAVPALAPAAMIVKAVGMVGTAYLLFLIFGPDRIATSKGKNKKDAGGLLMEAGIVAAVIAVAALLSKPFRDILARGWNALLGIFGLGVKKLETPEVLAQRIMDQLNAAKPVYNQKVADAGTLVEKLRLQIEGQAAKSAELDRGVTALLSDSDPNNDLMAETLLNQKKVIDGSIATNKEQLVLAEKALEGIKQDRANFFADAQEKLAKIQAGLTKAKAAEIQLELAKLKGGFQIGDLKDNEDRFDQAVNDKIAEAKGATDSVESNPDQILKKAKDELRNQEARDEIAKRKAAIEAARKAKENGAGALGGVFALGATEVLGALGLVGMAFAGGVLGALYGIKLGLNMMPALVKRYGPIAGYWSIPLGILLGSVAGGVALPLAAWLIALAL